MEIRITSEIFVKGEIEMAEVDANCSVKGENQTVEVGQNVSVVPAVPASSVTGTATEPIVQSDKTPGENACSCKYAKGIAIITMILSFLTVGLLISFGVILLLKTKFSSEWEWCEILAFLIPTLLFLVFLCLFVFRCVSSCRKKNLFRKILDKSLADKEVLKKCLDVLAEL